MAPDILINTHEQELSKLILENQINQNHFILNKTSNGFCIQYVDNIQFQFFIYPVFKLNDVFYDINFAARSRELKKVSMKNIHWNTVNKQFEIWLNELESISN